MNVFFEARQFPLRRFSHGVLGLITCCVVVTCDRAPTAGQSAKARVVWGIQDAAGAAAMPFADNDIAVFTSLNAPRVVALDATTGKLRWSQPVAGGPSGLGMPSSSVVAYGDEVVVGAWNLVAFARSTGDLRWTFSPQGEFAAAAPLAVAGNLIISPGSVGKLFAVDATNGSLAWQLSLGERPFGAVVSNGVIYVSASGYASDGLTLAAGHALAVGAIDGNILWRAALPNNPNGNWLGGAGGTGALTANAYIVASPSGNVYAFDRTTGSTLWKFDGPGPFISGVGVLGDVAVVAALTGDIFGLDVKTGTVRWRQSTGGSSVIEQITADENCAYVPVAELTCFSENGTIRWQIGGASRGGPLFITPAYSSGERIFIGAFSGYYSLLGTP